MEEKLPRLKEIWKQRQLWETMGCSSGFKGSSWGPSMGNKIHLRPEGSSCPTSTLQIKDLWSFLHMFKQGKVWVWLHARFTPQKFPCSHGAIYDLRQCMKNHCETFLCHLRYTSAFIGHLLLLSGIAAVLFLPVSFWKGESKIFTCVFSGKSSSALNICTGLHSRCWISLLFLKQFSQQPACWAWQDVG